MCQRHYSRWHVANRRGRGLPDARRGKPIAELLNDRIIKTRSCWVWMGTTDGKGYGEIRGKRVHRLMFEMHIGPIPAGHELDHLCRNRICCNPAHLEPVTSRENTLRGDGPAARNARKTHCPRGHPYDERNTWWRPRRNGWERHCRACNRARRWTLLDRVAANR